MRTIPMLYCSISCAAYEYPLREDEPLFDSISYTEGVEVLKEEASILPMREMLS